MSGKCEICETTVRTTGSAGYVGREVNGHWVHDVCAARRTIDRTFDEEFPWGAGRFLSLQDRFEDGLREAEEYGDDYVCVKVPSHSECNFPIALVRKALGRI